MAWCVVLFFVVVVVAGLKKKNHSSEFYFYNSLQLLLLLRLLLSDRIWQISCWIRSPQLLLLPRLLPFQIRYGVCVCSSDSMVFIVLLISNRLIEHRLSHDNIRFHLRFFFLIRLQVFAMLRTRAIVLRFKACFVFRRVYSLEFYNRFSCSALCVFGLFEELAHVTTHTRTKIWWVLIWLRVLCHFQNVLQTVQQQ